jgi:poly-gamma-glutamate capsule biosynthesis protein CapA/YwtB (metallophosphatase superfamily)
VNRREDARPRRRGTGRRAGDFGREGLLDTVETLDSAGIHHAGAGRDLGAA